MTDFAKPTQVLFLANTSWHITLTFSIPFLSSHVTVSPFMNLLPKIKVTTFKDLPDWHLKYFWDLSGVNTKDYFILVSTSHPKRSSFMYNIWQTNLVTTLIFKMKYSQLNAESIWIFSFMIYLKKKNLKRPWMHFHCKQLLFRLEN